MDKRHFLAATAAAGLLPAAARATAPSRPRAAALGPVSLTVSGEIGKHNRGPLDPALDALMAKQGVHFLQAWTFDGAALDRLPQVTIQPTVEYDAKVHRLQGPLLETVLQDAGVSAGAPVMVGLRAIDGYHPMLSLEDIRRYRMIVATRMDGVPLGIGGLGPQWAVYDADRLPEFKDKPLKERFGLCPWGLYHLEVRKMEGHRGLGR